jgi:hypothetical protein
VDLDKEGGNVLEVSPCSVTVIRTVESESRERVSSLTWIVDCAFKFVSSSA